MQELKANNLVIDFVDYYVPIKYLYNYENVKKVEEHTIISVLSMQQLKIKLKKNIKSTKIEMKSMGGVKFNNIIEICINFVILDF